MYPYIFTNHKGEVTKNYSPHVWVTVGKYKDMDAKTERYYQFTLRTGFGIDTNLNFTNPDSAFKYADKVLTKTFTEALKGVYETKVG